MTNGAEAYSEPDDGEHSGALQRPHEAQQDAHVDERADHRHRIEYDRFERAVGRREDTEREREKEDGQVEAREAHQKRMQWWPAQMWPN